MSETYELAKQFYEADGREIVNSTVGGKLEVFRRSKLEDEISRPCCKTNHKKPSQKAIKFCIATAFWKGDCEQAELHWRLLSRLGAKSEMHLYLFKHGAKDLPFVNLPRVECLEIEKKYPELASLPHPAGPNLAFVETLRLLSKTDCTHFFWMEPDCIPTSPNWMDSFLKVLEKHPEEPIIGTGGGTVTPGKIFWKNHFCGCSLYNIQQLSRLDWDSYLQNELNVSFDIWLSVQLGFIRLGEVNNSGAQDTIIYGNDRHEWELVRKPEGLVIGMFEHWRPEKFLTPEALEERLTWKGFSLFHAVKCPEIIGRLYKRLPKSATTIVINYNNGPYLHKCLESAINQQCDGIRHEVVVVDDGSTDESREIIESFGDSVRALFLSHGMLVPNFNQQRAFQAGFEIASGEIICLLDGDDFFYPTKLAHLSRFFDDPRTVVAQHILDMVDESGHFMNNRRRSFPEHEQVTPELYSCTGRVNWFLPTSGLCFLRAYLETQIPKLQPDEHANVWLDVRLTRFAPYYGKIVSSTTPLGAWRRHEKSDSIRSDNVDERVQKHEQWYDANAKSLGTPQVAFPWKKDKILFTAGNSESKYFESLGVETSPFAQKIDTGRWLFQYSNSSSTITFVFRAKQSLMHRCIFSAISISCTKPLRAKLSLARHGESLHENSSKEFFLNPGQSQFFSILHQFKNTHEALKIQITIPASQHKEFEMGISNLALFVLHEKSEKSESNLHSFHHANSLMRSGSYEDCIPVYYALAKKNPERRMYMENADFTLWKLGFKDEKIRNKIGEQLLQVVS
jgi:glycosyltransferase involved in cell wall biosynthesis